MESKDMLKKSWFLLGGLILVTGQVVAAGATELKSDKDKLSYSIGSSIGKNFKGDGTEVDTNLLLEGLRSSLAGEKSLLPEKEVRQIMNDYQTKLRQAAAAKRQQAISDNKKKGDVFLADYKAQAGVVAAPNGLLYKIVKEGSGKKPLESDMVEVNYRGALINGTEFDATEPGKPATLKVAALIPGWKQALSMMPIGSKWHIVVPPVLGYGERGVGSDIGPNEVLVFDLELVGIK
jgi:FKBP-type peptidyl-prolyl cis-trans isomerase FklB